MDCDVVNELLPAYVDGELDPPAIARLHQHLDRCVACTGALRELRQLRALMAAHAPSHLAPPALRARVLAAVAQEATAAPAQVPTHVHPAAPTRAQAAAPPPTASAPPPTATAAQPAAHAPGASGPPRRRHGWLARLAAEWRLGGAALASAACAALLTVQLAAPGAPARITDDVVASHLRSLQVDHLTDVASTDQHTVKPWFAGKLDFSPPVYDLAPQGFALLGGRLEYLDGRNVAALAYRHRQHLVNLFVWPAAGSDAAPRSHARQGIHMVQWRHAGMDYWLVSDLGTPELEQLCQLVRARVAANDPQ